MASLARPNLAASIGPAKRLSQTNLEKPGSSARCNWGDLTAVGDLIVSEGPGPISPYPKFNLGLALHTVQACGNSLCFFFDFKYMHDRKTRSRFAAPARNKRMVL